jgi:acetyl esterase/lipase
LASRPERHAYGDDPSQYGELTRAADPAAAPGESPAAPGESPGVAVLVHGGFWKAAYGCDLMHPLAADLAARGWTVWNLEYRRLGNGGGVPQTLDDVAAGIDHLAQLDGLDLARVVAIGHSAGGHLAAWAATRESPRVALTGVVAQAGVLDLRLARELRLSDATVHEFLDGLGDADLAAASPRERLPLTAPALLTHGAADDTVPLRMSREFAQAGGADLHVDPEAGHMEHLDPAHPLWQAVLAWL